jgi:hypothetical protein
MYQTEIQSILFDRNIWSIPNAYSWLVEHSIKPLKKPHLTEKYIRYRIRLPTKYKRFITRKTYNGISLVLGFK